MMCNQNSNWWSRIREWFKPTPIEPPTVDPEFPEMSGLERSAESVRFNLLSLEYWLSASGRLRTWMRNNMLLASLLSVPVLIVMPLVGLLLWQLVLWIGMLASLAGGLILVPVLALIAVLVITVVINLIKSLFGLK